MQCYIISLFFLQGLYALGSFRYKEHLEYLITQTDRQYPDVPEQWFAQILDHENPSSGNWQQRYYVNDMFYDPSNGGPAFLFIGGEAALGSGWATGGAWIEFARKYGALCFAVEHRYYGKSHPTRDLSTQNLKYLSSRQALADLAYFISSMNNDYELSFNTKWIVFGGSYSGNLAAWMRSKYPDLVHGAVASSAPILAKLDFSDYYRVVAESLRNHSTECLFAVSQAFTSIGTLLRSGPIGQQFLDIKLQLCNSIEQNINNPKYIPTFYDELAESFADIVQHNDNPRAALHISQACDIMTENTNLDSVDRLGVILKHLLTRPCYLSVYEDNIKFYTNIQWNPNNKDNLRQWTYQTCTEFGYFQSSSTNRSTFGDEVPVEYYIQMCRDIFEEDFDYSYISAAVDRTNSYYGGLDIKATNVVFVHGSLDPWHALGLTQTKDIDNPVILIQGTSHCADMGEDPQLQYVRDLISGYIQQWLSS